MTPVSQVFRIRLAYATGGLTTRSRILLYGRTSSSIRRFYSDDPSDNYPTEASAVVIGAGPAGLAVVGNLLEHGAELRTHKKKLAWVDVKFDGGRVNHRYREVPSNTKVGLFLQFAHDVSPFRAIIDEAGKPNAVTALQGLPQDQGCFLGAAADMCVMLTNGLTVHPQVNAVMAEAKSLCLDERTRTWSVGLPYGMQLTTPKVILCTGSRPVSEAYPPIDRRYRRGLNPVDLDIALAPSKLVHALDREDSNITVAVVGASHSAILVLMNLVRLAETTHPCLRIKWFTRNQLRYAEYMDGWILRDNTGLKGQAAEWAHQNLDDETFPSSPVSQVIKKVWTTEREEEVYKAELPGCTHIIQAVGYTRNPLPRMEVIREEGGAPTPLEIQYDHLTGEFYEIHSTLREDERKDIPGLFGAGIAFPERVTDPHGNVEYAVGFWKFMKFVKKVVPNWVKS